MIIKKDIYKIGIGIVVGFLLVVGGFCLGLSQARFANHFGDNYIKNIPGGHGASGKVISIATSTLILSNKNNVEKIITLNQDTKITKSRDNATTTDIKNGDFIVVIGEPDETGHIVAKFIRLMPLMMHEMMYEKNKRSY